MAKANYQVLEENRAKALEFAAKIIEQPKPVIPIDTTKKMEEAQEALKKGELSKAVMLLDEIKDNKLGIVWSESGNLGNGTRSRVRDARNVTTNPEQLKAEQGEKYAMQILSEVQAAMNFLDKNVIVNDAKREEGKQKLLYIARQALNNVGMLNSEEVKTYNTLMVSSMEKAGIDKAAEKLEFAMAFSTFQHEHMHITTLSNAKKGNTTHTVVEAEIMLNGLTPKLKAQYDAIRVSKPGAEVTVPGVDMDWYNKLPQYKKDLVYEAAGKIATGNYVIPTPMLAVLPGLRNAYEKVTAVKSPGMELKTVNDNLHCGAPASKAQEASKAGRQEIADSNVEQIQSYTKDGKVNLNVLNSGVLGQEKVNEGYIFAQLKNVAARIKEVSFSASPMNDWRKVRGSGRDHSEFKKSLEDIGVEIKGQTGLKQVSKYLRYGEKIQGGDAKEALKELEKYPDKETARVLKAAVEARSLIDTPVTLEKSNVNLAVTNKISIVNTAAKEKDFSLYKVFKKAIPYARIDFCKSGKDRTGYVQTKNSHEAVCSYLGIDPASKDGKANLLSQAAAGHTQEMAGIQGGTVGCHGIKQSHVFGLIKDDKGIDGIINQKTADNNALKTVESKKATAVVIDQFEQDFAAHKKSGAVPLTAPSAPSISNYDKLQQNREAVLNFAAKVPKNSKAIDTAQLLADAKNSLKGPDDNKFEVALQKLDQLKDARLGIYWHESGNLGHGTRALVRDARNVTLNPETLKHDADEKYAMQILNGVRAGNNLLDKFNIPEPQKSEAKGKLMFTAQYALDHIDNKNLPGLGAKNVIEFNTFIVDALDKAGVKNSAVELNFAKEMTNFRDEHRHIVTLTSVPDNKGKAHTVMEAEVMLNGLTESQKRQYEMIVGSKPGVKLGGDEMAWYNEMPKHRQDMLRDVARDIATGNKVIPTQLLGSLIGIRNAYEKITAIQGQGEQNPEILSQSLHCGAPATKIKIPGDKAREEFQKNAIVQEQVRQLQTFTPPDKKIHLNILTSKTPGDIRGEDFVNNQLEHVKSREKGKEVTVGASPINKWQAFGGGRDQVEFDKTLQSLGADWQRDQGKATSISDFLRNGGNPKNALKEIERFEADNPEKNAKLADILRVAVSTKDLLAQSANTNKSENPNLEITSKMMLIISSTMLKGGTLQHIASEDTKEHIAVNILFCKSGKDRTGYVELKVTLLAVAHRLGVDPDSDLGKKIQLTLAAGGHTQEMAGVQGGTIGCHSMKTNPEFGFNKADKDINGIGDQKSASFNSKIKVVEEKEKEKVLRKFEGQYNDTMKRETEANKRSDTAEANKGTIKVQEQRKGKPLPQIPAVKTSPAAGLSSEATHELEDIKHHLKEKTAKHLAAVEVAKKNKVQIGQRKSIIQKSGGSTPGM